MTANSATSRLIKSSLQVFRKLSAVFSILFFNNFRDRLLHHVRATHTDKRPYGCTVCDNTTCNDSNHYIHFQRHKRKGESNEYQIKCAYCGMIFQKDAVFEMHLIEGHPEEAVIV